MISLFGTDGIRGKVGSEPFIMDSLLSIGHAIGKWAIERYGATPNIILAHDTRASCSLVKSLIKSGLFVHPITVHDAGILPSPALLALMKKNILFDVGIIISASHNPYYDNGIKIVDTTGKITAYDEERISYLIEQKKEITYCTLGTEKTIFNAAHLYQEFVLQHFPVNMLSGKKIVLDCAHGATADIACSIFKVLGAQVIPLFNNPNGVNINKQCGALYPQTVQEAIVDQNADIGFAFDGDGDRVIAVNRYGQLKNGDDILALLLDHPIYKQMNTVVGTVMTNQGLQMHLEQQTKTLIRTAVGDKYIAEQLAARSLLIGGEPSGHIILQDYLPTGDGIFTALRICQTICMNGNWDLTTFKKFPQININIPVKLKKDLNESPLREIIEDSTKKLHNGRLLVRYSGTEPLLRIMIEDDDCDHAQMIGTFLSETLQQEIS